MAQPDWYAILGVPSDASAERIRQAWRQQAQRWHPDRRPGADSVERFHQAKQAFDVLIDPSRRADYDYRRRQPPPAAPATSPSSPPPSAGSYALQPAPPPRWWDNVGNWWRERRVLANPVVGDTAQIEIHLPLRDFFVGALRRVRLRIADTCECLGQRHCPRCRGTGQVFRWRQWDVRVPPGTSPNHALRLKGQGHDGPWFDCRGDVLVWVRWPASRPTWTWTSQGPEVALEVEDWEPKFKLALPDGRVVTLRTPTAPTAGQRWRLEGLGWPVARGRSDVWLAWQST